MSPSLPASSCLPSLLSFLSLYSLSLHVYSSTYSSLLTCPYLLSTPPHVPHTPHTTPHDTTLKQTLHYTPPLPARDELHRMLNEDELRDSVLLVFANKQDLPNAMSAAEMTDKLGLHGLRHRQWCVHTCMCVYTYTGS